MSTVCLYKLYWGIQFLIFLLDLLRKLNTLQKTILTTMRAKTRKIIRSATTKTATSYERRRLPYSHTFMDWLARILAAMLTNCCNKKSSSSFHFHLEIDLVVFLFTCSCRHCCRFHLIENNNSRSQNNNNINNNFTCICYFHLIGNDNNNRCKSQNNNINNNNKFEFSSRPWNRPCCIPLHLQLSFSFNWKRQQQQQ